MRAAYLIVTIALLAGLAGCGQGPKGEIAADVTLTQENETAAQR